MKKIGILAILAALCVALCSCVSTGPVEPLDHGFYPADGDASSSVEIVVEEFVVVTGIDEGSSNFATSVSGWAVKKAAKQEQIFRLSPGVHTVSVKFDDGKRYTPFSNVMVINLEEGNQYRIKVEVGESSVTYDCYNADTLESAKLDRNALAGNAENTISNFIGAVLNPTMEEVGDTVLQENDEYELYTYPGLKFKLVDKASGAEKVGMTTFVTDFSFKAGTVYFYETEMTDKDEFLDSDYQDLSQTILSVTACDKESVTYTYEKPEEKKGQTITFNISVEE